MYVLRLSYQFKILSSPARKDLVVNFFWISFLGIFVFKVLQILALYILTNRLFYKIFAGEETESFNYWKTLFQEETESTVALGWENVKVQTIYQYINLLSIILLNISSSICLIV